mmetsp:Transcript_8356/g.30890  ORF Transcript_8356/g.30890 Transcript_8356/m.30890 type:complete len:254 (-) Transcript_8356:644-1405(-)
MIGVFVLTLLQFSHSGGGKNQSPNCDGKIMNGEISDERANTLLVSREKIGARCLHDKSLHSHNKKCLLQKSSQNCETQVMLRIGICHKNIGNIDENRNKGESEEKIPMHPIFAHVGMRLIVSSPYSGKSHDAQHEQWCSMPENFDNEAQRDLLSSASCRMASLFALGIDIWTRGLLSCEHLLIYIFLEACMLITSCSQTHQPRRKNEQRHSCIHQSDAPFLCLKVGRNKIPEIHGKNAHARHNHHLTPKLGDE